MKISFLDFWGDFDPNHNFFLYLLRSIQENVEVVTPEKAELLIFSCYGDQNKKYNHCKKIFYTAENKRPKDFTCNYSLSFDFDESNNIRLPLWLVNIDFFEKVNYKNPQYVIPINYITNFNTNPFYKKVKKEFCVIVNNHFANRRDEILQALNKYKPVHGFGNPFKNWFYGEDNKLDIISNYRFNICFENSIYPGYYTEKLLHAKTAGCIPLCNSDSNINKDFNKKCFINLNDFDSVESYVNYIIEVENTPSLYKLYINEPLFETADYPVKYLEQIKNKLKKII